MSVKMQEIPDLIQNPNAVEQDFHRLRGLASSSNHPSDMRQQKLLNDVLFWFATIAKSSKDAIIKNDLSGIMTSRNKVAETIFRYASDDIVGRPISCIILPDLFDEDLIFARIHRDGKIARFETERKYKNDWLFPISLVGSLIRDDQNRIISASTSTYNLTEDDCHDDGLYTANAELDCLVRHLVRRRDRVEQENLAKPRFLAGMSHQPHKPLNSGHNLSPDYTRGWEDHPIRTTLSKYLLRAGDHFVEAAHMLADSAGTVGFERLAQLDHRFQQVIHSGPLDGSMLAGALSAVVEAMRDRSTQTVEA
jgi:PAS domain S-box-containing protein